MRSGLQIFLVCVFFSFRLSLLKGHQKLAFLLVFCLCCRYCSDSGLQVLENVHCSMNIASIFEDSLGNFPVENLTAPVNGQLSFVDETIVPHSPVATMNREDIPLNSR